MKIDFLRKKYPKFVYERYYYKIAQNNLKIFFDFKTDPDIRFKPTLIVKNIDQSCFKKIKKEVLDNLKLLHSKLYLVVFINLGRKHLLLNLSIYWTLRKK